MHRHRTTRVAVTRSVTQAPSENFCATVNVKMATHRTSATACRRNCRFQCSTRTLRCHQKRHIPSCESEKVTKTLMAYITTRVSIFPCVAMRSEERRGGKECR